jgi:outer membrane protein assembly factor BamB
MANQKPEQLSRGCVALINLVLSLIGLFFLAIVLLPGIASMPPWVKNLKNFTLIEKKQTLGPVFTLNTTEREQADKVLIINTQYRGAPLSQIFKSPKDIAHYQVFMTLKSPNDNQINWENSLPQSKINTVNPIKVVSDYRNLLIMDGHLLKSIEQATGKLLWQKQLSDRINPLCESCLQISLNNLAIALTEDQVLYVFEMSSGVTRWQMRLKNPLSRGQGFTIEQDFLIILDQILGNGQNKFVFSHYNLKDGQLLKQLPIADLNPEDYFLWEKGELICLQNSPKTTFMKVFNPGTGKINWQTALPENFKVKNTDFNKYSYTSEWLSADIQYFYLNIYASANENYIFKINRDTGQVSPLLQTDDYEFRIINSDANYLIINAIRTRGSLKSEIWVLEKKSGKIKVKHSLKSNHIYKKQSNRIMWDARIRQNKLLVLEFNDNNGNFHLAYVDLLDGNLFNERNFTLKPDFWTGITWTSKQAFLSIRNVYKLDLEKGVMMVEYP